MDWKFQGILLPGAITVAVSYLLVNRASKRDRYIN